MLKKLILHIFPLIISIATIFSLFWDNVIIKIMNGLPFRISFVIRLILGVITIAYIIVSLKEMLESNQIMVRFGSKRYIKIFKKFYSQEGHLSIFCKNLDDWVNGEILSALTKKANDKKLNILVFNEDEISQRLKSLGAKVNKTSAVSISHLRFSLLDVDGSCTSLLRNTEKNKNDSMKIERTNDVNITMLLQYLLNNEKTKRGKINAVNSRRMG